MGLDAIRVGDTIGSLQRSLWDSYGFPVYLQTIMLGRTQIAPGVVLSSLQNREQDNLTLVLRVADARDGELMVM